MATATPETLGTVFSQILAEVEKQAADQSDKLTDILDQLGALVNDVTNLPGDLWRDLKDLVEHPNWWSLLLFLMVKISEIDPAHLKAGAMKPPNWSRMVTLTYTNPPVPAITLGLALVKDVEGGVDQKRGVLIRTAGPVPLTPLQNAASPFGVSIAASGAAEWRIPFSGSIEPPVQNATVDLAFTWDPPDLLAGSDGVTTGAARVAVKLTSTPGKLYTLRLGLGDSADPLKPGLKAAVDLSPKLGVLGEVVKIAKIDERYTPEYTRASDAAPAFNLNHRSVS
jgi:hypothetical protein